MPASQRRGARARALLSGGRRRGRWRPGRDAAPGGLQLSSHAFAPNCDAGWRRPRARGRASCAGQLPAPLPSRPIVLTAERRIPQSQRAAHSLPLLLDGAYFVRRAARRAGPANLAAAGGCARATDSKGATGRAEAPLSNQMLECVAAAAAGAGRWPRDLTHRSRSWVGWRAALCLM